MYVGCTQYCYLLHKSLLCAHYTHDFLLCVIWWTGNSNIALHFSLVEQGSICVCFTFRQCVWRMVCTFIHCTMIIIVVCHQISVVLLGPELHVGKYTVLESSQQFIVLECSTLHMGHCGCGQNRVGHQHLLQLSQLHTGVLVHPVSPPHTHTHTHTLASVKKWN